MSEQQRLNHAVLYALESGCFFPVSKPKRSAPVESWVKWGAMRYLHDAISDFTQTDAYREIRPLAVTPR